jgi:hypothetical protein
MEVLQGQQIDNVLIDGNEFFVKNIRWLRKTSMLR